MKSLSDYENMNGQGEVQVVDIPEKKTIHAVRPITNINIYGLTFYYDEESNKVGFPEWYNYDSRHLDPRVGHQNWIDKEIAEAIIYRVIELRDAFNERQKRTRKVTFDERDN